MINIGFIIGSHYILYSLGLLEAEQFLTGIKENPKPISRFHIILIIILFMLSSVSSLVIVAKKFEANWKDRKMIQALNIMIKDSEGKSKQNFNNNRHNRPIVDDSVLLLFVLMLIGFTFGWLMHSNGSTSDHIKSFWVGWTANIFLRTVFPVSVTALHLKPFRCFIMKTFYEILEKLLARK